MQLYKNVFSKEKLTSRERTGDFVARFGNILLSFEMNNTNTLERNVEYVNKLYSEFASSKDLQEEVETIYVPVFQLNMNNFVFKGETDTIKISYASDGKRMRVKIIFIDVYLPNIEKKYNRLEKGLEQGLEQGIEQGLATVKEEDAQKMLQKKYTLEDIMGITGISLERLNKLKNTILIA